MKEKLSALLDSELTAQECDAVLSAMQADPALHADWQQWHLVGDVLKQEHPILSPDFMSRFSERLAAEPIVIAPVAHRRKRDILRRAIAPVSVAASVAFVSMVGWQAYRGAAQTPASVQTTAQAAVNGQVQPMVAQAGNNPRLRAYLAAHRIDNGNVFASQDVMAVSYQEAPAR
ncbi:sigma-E factor negative regulatory protein RseA [Andreprevotia lacus DSM 23236]|jgi:sigma-E factor negative regulatory protein RseA|uniref:Sigma-E factor negative regulatory protein RseA n=1 Tax=Andreprevotia lacus DSM 23236 TaxID=1121001 RepID=A0A1W1XN27_9NEIS|nr:sigma-E factor negative regulatory protein [Andreprevotia lacus]SMC25272.1 sigma-E factor negative regulatory protein RseA [Andreprevotia lacus DSM 23236]